MLLYNTTQTLPNRHDTHACRVIKVFGQVQGVGFRPFVYRLAVQLDLQGWVHNTAAGVSLLVQGPAPALNLFQQRLQQSLPPAARIKRLQVQHLNFQPDISGFRIAPSTGGGGQSQIPPDGALCNDCLEELFNPGDRRYRYPFTHCMHCGPRYTMTRRLPFDRENTTMAAFPLCRDCQDEYTHAGNRRFHAQSTACPQCGPTLALAQGDGTTIDCQDIITEVAARIRNGAVVAVKGTGGFHLVCDARKPESVSALRRRKNRDSKPFALMALNTVSVKTWVDCNTTEEALLQSPERPIVLLPKKPGCDDALAHVAPGMAWLGWMLPSTPVHYLLFNELLGRPDHGLWLHQPHELVLVMTSANPNGEPIVTGNEEAFERLHGIADVILTHNRDITMACDDSVVQVQSDQSRLLRRARGYTPVAIPLPCGGPSVLACGGYLKNTVCLTKGDQAYLSQHIGTLDNRKTRQWFQATVDHLMTVLDIQPQWVVHDRHPDFYSSHYAVDFAQRHELPTLAVQHHCAHIQSTMVEHGLQEPVLGLALDGIGLGDDGDAWGGELFRLDGHRCQRMGGLKPLGLPGGDQAAREPWRMAVAVLHTLDREDLAKQRFADRPAFQSVLTLLQHRRCPLTSSAGRLFDAAASLLAGIHTNGFDGHAAMVLESLAVQADRVKSPCERFTVQPHELNMLPLFMDLLNQKDGPRAAARFHLGLARGLALWIEYHARQNQLSKVVLSGGCFANRCLTGYLEQNLRIMGITCFHSQSVPCNDGGIALGQAWMGVRRANAQNEGYGSCV